MGTVFKRDDSKFWIASYKDHTGRRVKRSTGCRDKANALKMLAAWEVKSRHIEGGLEADHKDERLADAINEYCRSSTKSADYVRYTRLQIERVVTDQKWTMLSDVTAKGLEAFIHGLKATNRTKHSHVTAFRMFTRWCVKRGKLKADPVATVEKPAPQKSKRRMLQKEEWNTLAEWLEANDIERNGQSSIERLLMYWAAIETGLRSAELLSLKRGDLHLDVDEPFIHCTQTKNGKPAQQFVSDALAMRLADFVSRKTKNAMVFKVNSNTRLAQYLRNDCDDARGDNTCPDFLRSPDSQGRILDFHCLRHTCGSWLTAAGVPLTEVQAIMRHSTITLTVDRYGHLAPDALSRNRNVLGKMLG